MSKCKWIKMVLKMSTVFIFLYLRGHFFCDIQPSDYFPHDLSLAGTPNDHTLTRFISLWPIGNHLGPEALCLNITGSLVQKQIIYSATLMLVLSVCQLMIFFGSLIFFSIPNITFIKHWTCYISLIFSSLQLQTMRLNTWKRLAPLHLWVSTVPDF